MTNLQNLKDFGKTLTGELKIDPISLTLYSTDASAYQEQPIAVCIPESIDDIHKLILFANENDLPLIPRTAGTSLAGQVVGKGIIVDVGKKLNKILEINTEENWVRVQPGVIRDELNMILKEYGFFFGPETSTANRAMMGGMIGNNSCGSNSVVYGSTRDHLLEVKGFLSDGSECTFKELSTEEYRSKLSDSEGLEKIIYQNVEDILSNSENIRQIEENYPKKSIPRRNTGYALDLLADTAPFNEDGENFNFCKLIAGSEGTLVFMTEAKLHIDPLPPKHLGLLCLHFESVYESLLGNLEALKFNPSACELIDHYILDCTKDSIEQTKNRFFVQGEPKAILVVELRRESEEELQKDAEALINVLKEQKLGYHYPLITGEDTTKVWNLRKAGLGLLSNMPGDAKPVPVIEDTAVDVQDLPEYIKEFNEHIATYGLFCVHYAHAGSGELHLRPIINLKTQEGNQLFKKVAEDISVLVKKYKGSLSGEHGDGRLRGEFIPYMIGEHNYQLLKEVKKAWDPKNLFNPGKIVDTPAMNKQLRYHPGQDTPQYDTILRFDRFKGILRNVELCNGSGDCRKTEKTGGTMCPSYMATRDEKETTRGRANILREILSNPDITGGFGSEKGKDVLDLCLSCKGCKAECPSSVDMAKIKAEYTHQYYIKNGIPFRTRLMAHFTRLYGFAAMLPRISNGIIKNRVTSNLIKQFSGIATNRSLPPVSYQTLWKWYSKNYSNYLPSHPQGSVYLFADEFTNLTDSTIGITAVKLLTSLGYDVRMERKEESGRTYFSKGFLNKAKKAAIDNVQFYKEKISPETPLVGIEPSAILSFRDEYSDIVPENLKANALRLSKNCLTLEEFVAREWQANKIKRESFTSETKEIILHGHCHQKALSSNSYGKNILSIPENYSVKVLPTGCCGMAGSFGYEKEHFELSNKVGSLVLFPEINKTSPETIIAAPGTSCRHQIKDGTQRKALHPVEILWNAYIKS